MKKNIYLGTLQLSDKFIGDKVKKERLLRTALENGICNFDTAAVYGDGNVETFLGNFLPKDVQVLTKVAAINKPDLIFGEIESSYPSLCVTESVKNSIRRLQRAPIDVVLAHNWSRNWKKVNTPLLELVDLKSHGVIKRIGISLPNGFGMRLSDEICNIIDVVEVPCNENDFWIKDDIDYYKSFGIEIILRSIFSQGLSIRKHNICNSFESTTFSQQNENTLAEKILIQTWNLETSVVFGATKPEQIINNVLLLKSLP